MLEFEDCVIFLAMMHLLEGVKPAEYRCAGMYPEWETVVTYACFAAGHRLWSKKNINYHRPKLI